MYCCFKLLIDAGEGKIAPRNYVQTWNFKYELWYGVFVSNFQRSVRFLIMEDAHLFVIIHTFNFRFEFRTQLSHTSHRHNITLDCYFRSKGTFVFITAKKRNVMTMLRHPFQFYFFKLNQILFLIMMCVQNWVRSFFLSPDL